MPRFPQVQAENEIEVLKELPVETIYLALKECDSETALWFFQNAAPEQVQGILDIDCWRGDEFQPERFENYFKALCLVEPTKLAEYMRRLDPEIVVRGLRQMVEVRDFDPQEPPNVPEDRLLISLDNKYALILHSSNNAPLREALYLWMNKFSAADMELLRRHLEACKWEENSDLEEFAYQVKRGRLEEMGFVDRLEAIQLYSVGMAADLKARLLSNPLEEGAKLGIEIKAVHDDADSPVIQNEEFLPEPIRGPLFEEGFLAEAFRKVNNPTLRSVLLMELVRVVNASLAADDLLHESLERIKEGSQRARRYLNLGLAYISNGQSEEAATLLARHPLGEVFRLGWLSTQDLVKAAKLVRNNFGTQIFATLDEELLKALEGRHPELYPSSLRNLEIQSNSLVSLEGVLRTGQRVAALQSIGAFVTGDLATALELKERPLAAGESAFARLITGLTRQCATEAAVFNCRPLHADEWKEIAERFDAEKLQRAVGVLAARCPEAGRAHFERCLRELSQEIAAYLAASGKTAPHPRNFKALVLA